MLKNDVNSVMKILKFTDAKIFKEYIDKHQEDFSLDLTSMNFFDCIQFLVLSSVYYSQKRPDRKLKCKISSNEIISIVSDFRVQNLEFI